MLCLSPIWIKHRQVPCGQCRYCRENRRNDIAVRAALENRCHDKSVFLTLTYSDEWLPADGSVHKRVMQLFKKRLSKYTRKKLRYVACGEYGSQYSRCHYHLLVYGLGKDDPVFYNWKGKSCYCKVWSDPKTGKPYGFCYVGTVTMDSCRYVAKYVCKKLTGDQAVLYKEKGIEPEFCLLPRRPALGLVYLEENKDILANKGYTEFKGRKFKLSRYYQDKLKAWIDGYEKRLSDSQFDYRVDLLKKRQAVCDKHGYSAVKDYEQTRRENAEAKSRLYDKKGVLDG